MFPKQLGSAWSLSQPAVRLLLWMTPCSSASHCSPFLALPNTGLPRTSPIWDCWTSPSFHKWKFGSYCCASWCLPIPLSFLQTNLCLPTRQEEEEEGDCSHAVTAVNHGNITEAKQIQLMFIFSEQDSQYVKTLSSCLVKPFAMVELEAPDFSGENWKNTPL